MSGFETRDIPRSKPFILMKRSYLFCFLCVVKTASKPLCIFQIQKYVCIDVILMNGGGDQTHFTDFVGAQQGTTTKLNSFTRMKRIPLVYFCCNSANHGNNQSTKSTLLGWLGLKSLHKFHPPYRGHVNTLIYHILSYLANYVFIFSCSEKKHLI